ncbi:hypothetical protein ACHAQJ_002332 [Trichoderma viride]
MEAGRQFSGNNVGDFATIYQGNVTRTTNIVNAAHSNANDAFLREISKTNPIDDKERILASKGPLLYESFCWILEHEHFMRWRDTRDSGVLWIKGDPGKGKTMLLCGIVEEFEKDQSLRGKFAYFFCQGTDSRINAATAVIRGLIYAFLYQHPELLSYIRGQNEKEPEHHLEGPNEWFALCRIFKSVIKDPCITDPICVIDALDECQSGKSLDLLLDLIVDTSSHVKWLLSSRNEEEIEHGLDAIEEHQRLVLELKGNSEYVSKAVDIYIDRCVQDIKALKNDADLRIKTMNSLKTKANGTFLWVTLVVQQLRNTRRPHITTVLKKMPEGLQNLYNEIMKRAKKGWGDDENACLVLLATVTVAERPLRLDELYMFISSQLSDLEVTYTADDVTDLAKACGSFISIKNDTVYFIHQSVKDYMARNTDMSILPLGIEHQHYRMFEISLFEMDKTLQRNMYTIRSPGKHINDITPPDPNPLTPKGYCCAFWVEHLVHCCQSQLQYRECLKDTGTLHSFLQKNYLYWLEAMALLKSMPLAVLALQKLQNLITDCCVSGNDGYQVLETPRSRKKRQKTNQMLELTRDIYRLISEHRTTIEDFPVQIYASALIFCPTESTLRKTFETAQCPKWIITEPIVRLNWNACIRTIEGHEGAVDSLVFSPDSAKLASCSRDGTAKVWDLTTGACLHTFKSDDIRPGTRNASFSPNGNQLALVTHRSIEIWDLSISTCLKINQPGVDSVTFIADGARLAIVSTNTINIHDLATNINLQTYRSRLGERFHGVIFPSSCTQLPSTINGDIIKTWDLRSSTEFTHQTFGTQLVAISERSTSSFKLLDLATGKHSEIAYDRSRDYPNSAVLSSDGVRLASRSDSNAITIWNFTTESRRTLGFHTTGIGAIAFSPNGMQLASASDTINIWSLATHECEWPLKGHASTVHSLAFSPDGLRLASGGSDNTIKVWDLALNEPLRNSDDHANELTEMKYSPAGILLVSRSNDTLKIWDPATGVCLRTFFSNMVTDVIFSPDSKRLAISHLDGCIYLWDLKAVLPPMSFQIPESRVSSMAFSPNGTKLAVSYGYVDPWKITTYTILIWDPSTGDCLQVMELDCNPNIEMIIFSPDSTQLWGVSTGGNVHVWDPFTGKCIQILERLVDPKSFLKYRHDPIIGPKAYAELLQQLSTYLPEEQGFVGSNTRSELDISKDRTWILRKQEPVLRLPPEYRPVVFAEYGNFCAIGTSSYQVLCFQFSFDGLDAEFNGE